MDNRATCSSSTYCGESSRMSPPAADYAAPSTCFVYPEHPNFGSAAQADSDDEIVDVVTPMSPVTEFIDDADLVYTDEPMETTDGSSALRSCLSSKGRQKRGRIENNSKVRFSENCTVFVIPNTNDDDVARLSQIKSAELRLKFLKIKNRKRQRRRAIRAKKNHYSNAAVSTDVDGYTEKPQFRCCETLYGHQRGINRVRFSPDGKWIASASNDNTVKVFSFHNSALENTFIGHFLSVNDVAWCCKSEFLLSASSDQTLILWSREDNRRIQCFEGHEDAITCCAIDPLMGERGVSGSADNSIRVWHLTSGTLLHVLNGHEGAISAISFHKDGRQLASAAVDGHVLIWDAVDGKLMMSLFGDPGLDFRNPLTFMTYTENCDMILTSDTQSKLVISNIDNSEVVKEFSGSGFLNKTLPVTACIMSAPGKPMIVIGGSEDDKVRIWNLNSMELLQTLPVADDYKVLGIDIHPTEQILATSCVSDRDTVIRVWISP